MLCREIVKETDGFIAEMFDTKLWFPTLTGLAIWNCDPHGKVDASRGVGAQVCNCTVGSIPILGNGRFIVFNTLL